MHPGAASIPTEGIWKISDIHVLWTVKGRRQGNQLGECRANTTIVLLCWELWNPEFCCLHMESLICRLFMHDGADCAWALLSTGAGPQNRKASVLISVETNVVSLNIECLQDVLTFWFNASLARFWTTMSQSSALFSTIFALPYPSFWFLLFNLMRTYVGNHDCAVAWLFLKHLLALLAID